MKIIACYSNKGGVGKTASSVNVAYGLAKAGQRVLLCDLDPQGASGFYFRVKPSKKLTAPYNNVLYIISSNGHLVETPNESIDT